MYAEMQVVRLGLIVAVAITIVAALATALLWQKMSLSGRISALAPMVFVLVVALARYVDSHGAA